MTPTAQSDCVRPGARHSHAAPVPPAPWWPREAANGAHAQARGSERSDPCPLWLSDAAISRHRPPHADGPSRHRPPHAGKARLVGATACRKNARLVGAPTADSRRRARAPQESVEQLIEMGFTELRAQKALAKTSNAGVEQATAARGGRARRPSAPGVLVARHPQRPPSSRRLPAARRPPFAPCLPRAPCPHSAPCPPSAPWRRRVSPHPARSIGARTPFGRRSTGSRSTWRTRTSTTQWRL